MASHKNVFGEHAPSLTEVSADELGNQETRPDLSLQSPTSMPTSVPTNVESWDHPCAPVLQSPPFRELTDLTREQLERPSERTRSRIPVDNLRAQHSYGPPPAVAEASLATAEVNSSGAQAGSRQRGRRDSINVSGKPPALMIGGARASNGGSERGASSANLYSSFPRGQGLFPSRRPQVRSPPRVPFLTSGIMMELPPVNIRPTYKDRVAQASFPRGGPQNPVDNWSRPVSLTSSTQGLPSCPAAHGFVNPQHPNFNPLLPLPIAFAPPPIVNPPQQSHYATYPSWGIPDPACPKRENK